MHVLKQRPDDFIVEEVYGIVPKDSGRYGYYILKKREYTTMRAVQHIAEALRIPLKRIGFAGTKDKIAVTTQLISIDSVSKERVERLKIPDIEIRFFGNGDSPISLGDLSGNRFDIIIRNIERLPIIPERFLNTFGEQRFSKNNVEIGKAMLRKDFASAVRMIAEVDKDFSDKSKEYLSRKENDFVGALRLIPRKILLLYVHSYQSYVWNRTVENLVNDGVVVDKVPIAGFGTLLTGEVGKRVMEILSEDGINQRDFIIRSIPELSSEGDIREAYIDVKDMDIGKLEDDELNAGKKKVRVRFRLPKGCYATEVVGQMFASRMTMANNKFFKCIKS